MLHSTDPWLPDRISSLPRPHTSSMRSSRSFESSLRGKARRAYAGAKSSDEWDDVVCVTWSDDGKGVSYGCRKGAEIFWRKLDVE